MEYTNARRRLHRLGCLALLPILPGVVAPLAESAPDWGAGIPAAFEASAAATVPPFASGWLSSMGFTPSSRPARLPRRAVTGMAVSCSARGARFGVLPTRAASSPMGRVRDRMTTVTQVRQCPSSESNPRPNRPVRMFLIVSAITGDSGPMQGRPCDPGRNVRAERVHA